MKGGANNRHLDSFHGNDATVAIEGLSSSIVSEVWLSSIMHLRLFKID